MIRFSTGIHRLSKSSNIELYEKTLDVHKDSEYIFSNYFLKFINDLSNNKLSNSIINTLNRDEDIYLYKGTTDILKSPDCIKANNFLNTNLFIGIFYNDSRVDFDLDTFTSDIYLSLPYHIIRDLAVTGYDLKKVSNWYCI